MSSVIKFLSLSRLASCAASWFSFSDSFLASHSFSSVLTVLPSLAVHRVRELSWNIFDAAPALVNSVSFSNYSSASFSLASSFLKFPLVTKRDILGARLLLRARLGCFWSASRAAHFTNPTWSVSCPFCHTNSPETLDHMLTSCSCWSNDRAELLSSLNSTLSSPLTTLPHFSVLLGGCFNGFSLGPAWFSGARPVFLFVARFFASIYPHRCRILWSPPVV